MNVAEHTPPLVDMLDLTVAFTGGRAPVKAVNGVSLQVRRGETVALIGESGSGKSVTLRTMLMLHAAKRTQLGGKLMVAGRDVLAMKDGELADYRGKVASMIFQEPLLALDRNVSMFPTQKRRQFSPNTLAQHFSHLDKRIHRRFQATGRDRSSPNESVSSAMTAPAKKSALTRLM